MDDPTFDRLQDESLSHHPEHASVGPDPLLSRRRLLSGAGSGFALAASGLLVPEGVAGVERQRPVERILNDPRERNRKDRNRKDRNDNDRNRKNRNRKNRNDNDRDDNDVPGIGLLNVELNFFAGSKLTHEIEVWQAKDPISFSYELKWPRQKVPPYTSLDHRQMVKFTGTSTELVLVDFSVPETGPIFFRVTNNIIKAPIVNVIQGSWGSNGVVNSGTIYYDTYDQDPPLLEGQRVRIYTNKSPFWRFFIDRTPDSRYHKIYYINPVDVFCPPTGLCPGGSG